MSAGFSGGVSGSDMSDRDSSSTPQRAGEAAGQVAGTAQEQAREVASEAKAQVKDLGRELKGQVDEQATTQRDRLVDTLRSLSEELERMVDQGGQSGMATDAARQLADRGRRAADFLADRQPGDLVQQVSDFARRRSGAFLGGAAVAGLLAGRLTRGATAAKSSDGSADGYVPQYGTQSAGIGTQYPPPVDVYAPADPGLYAATPAVADMPEYQATPPVQPSYGSTEQDYPATGYEPPFEGQRTDSGREGYRP